MNSSSFVHPTACIAPTAVLAADVRVGAYSIIEDAVEIAAGTVIGPHCHLLAHTRLGVQNTLATGVVIGAPAQDLRVDPAMPSRVEIGARNTLREYVTIHRSATAAGCTSIGDDNFIMCQAHLAHDVKIASAVTIVNSALLAGYVHVDAHAFISGHVVIHQHVRIGTGAMLSGMIRVGSDVPPYALAAGFRACFAGLNVTGLRRVNVKTADRKTIKTFYREFYASTARQHYLESAAAAAAHDSPLHTIIGFLQNSKRGVIEHRTSDATATML